MLRFRRFLTVLLLAWLPLQASALPMLALHCEAGHEGHALAVPAHHADLDHEVGMGGEDHETRVQDGHDDTDTVHQHFCCHHFAALPVTEPRPQAHAALAPTERLALTLFSFFPEPKRRPPRA
jgi:hypothetical protein